MPQGSVLGPLLFSCFINDVTDQLDPTASTKLFADDIKLYTSFSNILMAQRLAPRLARRD